MARAEFAEFATNDSWEESGRRSKQELQAAQSCMTLRVNAHCRELQFNPGGLVMLGTKNLRQPGIGVRKLKPSYMGPFELDSMVGMVGS